jgi:hypothetical protein
MRKSKIAALALGLGLLAGSQVFGTPQRITSDDPQSSSKQTLILPLAVGTAFNAELVTPLDTGRNRAGDTFTAQVTEDVRYERTVVIPKGTLLVGHLVRASARERRGQESALFLQFDKAILPSSEEALLSAGIQALAPKRDGHIEDQPDKAVDADTVAEPAELGRTTTVETIPTVTRTAPLVTPSLPPTQGEFTPAGLLEPDSHGALGMPSVKIYTPLSEGSNGTVLLSAKKRIRLDRGTRLLVVIQPPPAKDVEQP